MIPKSPRLRIEAPLSNLASRLEIDLAILAKAIKLHEREIRRMHERIKL